MQHMILKSYSCRATHISHVVYVYISLGYHEMRDFFVVQMLTLHDDRLGWESPEVVALELIQIFDRSAQML